MANLPSIAQGLEVLLAGRSHLQPLAQSIEKPKDLAQRAADNTPEVSCARTLSEIRDEVLAHNDSSKVGHLLSRYTRNRDSEMAVLCGITPDILLSILSQGVLPAEAAQGLNVSYDVFTEYLRLTCSVEELKAAEKLGADNLVAQGLKDLDGAIDRDDVAKYRALMDIKLKIAKSMNSKYIEQKPTTAVQVNNYSDGSPDGAQIPFLQILEPREEDLPPLRPHVAKIESVNLKPEPIEGEYELFTGDET